MDFKEKDRFRVFRGPCYVGETGTVVMPARGLHYVMVKLDSKPEIDGYFLDQDTLEIIE